LISIIFEPGADVVSAKQSVSNPAQPKGVAGSATGALAIGGECWMTELTYDATVSDRVPLAATFQVDGVPALTTF